MFALVAFTYSGLAIWITASPSGGEAVAHNPVPETHTSKSKPEVSPDTLILDPVILIEPEHGIVFSTKPPAVLGKYDIYINNIGVVNIQHVEIEQRFFLAEKSLAIIFKNLGGKREAIPFVGAKQESPPISVDFNLDDRLNTAKQVASNFQGLSLLGVRITVKYRAEDGRPFTLTKLYGSISPQAAGIYAEGDGPDRGVPIEYRDKFLTLSEIAPYAVLEEHWTSVIKDVTIDAQGRVITKQH